MIQVRPETEAEALQERLERGAALLFDMEQRGNTGAEYERWLDHFTDLLRRYETAPAA